MYDEDFDWPLIVASFAKQYGIRLEREDLPYREYRLLLAGIMYETPLGETVRIRAETDMKKIREMTAHEKKIRSDWQKFKNAKKTLDFFKHGNMTCVQTVKCAKRYCSFHFLHHPIH